MQPNSNVEILIAEDSLSQAKHLQQILESQSYRVTHVPNGTLALEAARRNKPALVISDVVMPEMNGYQLCRQIKADAGICDVPIILLTMLSDPQDVLNSLECRADSFIIKPFDAQQLISRVKFTLLNNGVPQAGPAGSGVEISLHENRHLITLDRLKILNLLIATYDAASQRQKELRQAQKELREISRSLAEAKRRLELETRELETAEQAMWTSEESLSVTLRNIGDAVLFTDDKGRITRINAAAEMFTGWTHVEAYGRAVGEVFHIVNAGTREPMHLPVTATLAQGTVQGLANSTILVARDGAKHSIVGNSAPIFSRARKVIGAVQVFRAETARPITGNAIDQ